MKISKFFKMSAVALAAAGFSGAALADTAETKGGLKIKTDDGRFEMSIGGRIQYDYYFLNDDDDAAFGSGVLTGSQNAGFFRRARLSFAGKLYGWEYLFVPDFSQNTGGAAAGTGATAGAAGVVLQELYVATDIWGGKLFIGQFKPFRGLEELTSSNEISFLERPYTTASGLYANQYVQGLGYQRVFMDMINVAGNVYSPRRDSTALTSGYGAGARVAVAPLNSEGMVVHLAGSFGYEHSDNSVSILTSSPRYAGRRGPAAGAFPAGTVPAVASNNSLFNYAIEAAAVLGPVFFQSEIGHADFQAAGPGSGAAADLGVLAYHAAATWFVTGETKPYDLKKGVFKSPKPNNSWGAVELTTRFEKIENQEAPSGAAVVQDVANFIAGVNYYVNPNLRFMVNYNFGNAARADDTHDKPESIGIRTALYW